jgi:tetratricopeptide (TPR) repeat protein
MFEKAIEIDPKFAAAYAGLGWTHNYDAAYGWNTEPDRALRAAHQLVQKAIRLEPSNASAHTLLSQIHVYRQRLDLAIAAIDRAIELNGSAAESHAHRGWVMLAAGQPQEAIASGETALRFDPNSSPVVFGNLGWAYFIAKRYEDAIATLERALTLTKDSEYPFALIALVASYVESGRSAEAARSSEALRRLSPFFDVAEFSLLFQDASDRTRIVASLRSVGFE